MASSGASAEAARAVEAGSAGDRRRCVTPQCGSWRCAPRMLRAASQIAMSLAEPARSFGNPPSSLANDRGQALTIIMPGQPDRLTADNEHYVKFGPCRPGVTASIGLVRRRFADLEKRHMVSVEPPAAPSPGSAPGLRRPARPPTPGATPP